MEYVLIWSLAILIISIVALVLVVKHKKSKEDCSEKQRELNLQVIKVLEDTNFKPTKFFYISDDCSFDKINEYKKIVIIDENNSKACFINYENGETMIVGFNEILNYEIYENGGQIYSGGAFGGMFGGLFAGDVQGKCNELKLIIRLKNFNTPQIVYDIIQKTYMGMGVSKASQDYKNCIISMQEVVSFLEVVKHENKQGAKHGEQDDEEVGE